MGQGVSCGGCLSFLAPSADEVGRLRAEVSALQQELRSMRTMIGDVKRDISWGNFSVVQYNILAGYLGDNCQPWFLYGIEVSDETRAAIVKKFYETDPQTGGYTNPGWPRYVEGILSKDQQRIVEEYHEKYFRWDLRQERLVQELQRLDADILSLVELDAYERVRGALPEHDGVFEKRPRPSSKDGCGVFFRRSKFELIAKQGIAFVDRVTDQGLPVQDRCGLIMHLRFRHAGDTSSGRDLVVVSTHLARNPENPKMTFMRAKQVTQLARSLTAFTDAHDIMSAPVVMCGDMNAKDYGEISGIAQSIFQISGEQVHPFFWQADDIKTGPTSVTSSRNVRIDVILFQPIHLKVIDISAERSVETQIPDADHPSDHIPIRVHFQVKADHRKNFTRANLWLQSMVGERVVEPLTGSELRDAFNFFDADRSGTIERHELELSCSELNTMLNTYQQEELFKCFPMESITFKDFISAYEIQYSVCKRRNLDTLGKAFRFFDANGDGNLDFREFREAVIQLMPVSLDERQIRSVWDKLTPNEFGVVDIDSFCQEMCSRATIAARDGPAVSRKSSSFLRLQRNLEDFRVYNDNIRRPQAFAGDSEELPMGRSLTVA